MDGQVGKCAFVFLLWFGFDVLGFCFLLFGNLHIFQLFLILKKTNYRWKNPTSTLYFLHAWKHCEGGRSWLPLVLRNQQNTCKVR